jgi:hypothetical protein
MKDAHNEAAGPRSVADDNDAGTRFARPAIVSSLNRPNDHRIRVVPSPGRHFNYRGSSEAPLIDLGA